MQPVEMGRTRRHVSEGTPEPGRVGNHKFLAPPPRSLRPLLRTDQFPVSFGARIRSRRTGQVFLESRGEGVPKILRFDEWGRRLSFDHDIPPLQPATTPDVIYRAEDDEPDEGICLYLDGMKWIPIRASVSR